MANLTPKPPQPSFKVELESVLEDLDAWYLHTPHHLMTTKDNAFKALLAAHQDSVREAELHGKAEMYNELWNIAKGDDFIDGIPNILRRLGEMHDEIINELARLRAGLGTS